MGSTPVQKQIKDVLRDCEKSIIYVQTICLLRLENGFILI